MSDPYWKKIMSEFKDSRQAPIGDEIKKSKSKKKNSHCILYKANKEQWSFHRREWTQWGKYRSKEIANNTIENLRRKYPFFLFKIEEL